MGQNKWTSKKNLQQQLREIEKFASMDLVFRDKQEEVWKEELGEIERNGTELLLQHQKMQKKSQKLKSLRDKQRNHLKTARDCEEKHRSMKSGRKGKHTTRRASEACRKGRATLGKWQQRWNMRSRTCRQVKREEAAVRRNPMDAALIRPFWSNSSRWEQPRQCSSPFIYMEKSAEFLVVNIGQGQPLRSEGQELRRRKLGKKNGIMRGWPMGGMRVLLLALLWILLKSQMLSV